MIQVTNNELATVIQGVVNVLSKTIEELPNIVGAFKGNAKNALIADLRKQLEALQALGALSDRHRDSLDYARNLSSGWVEIDKTKELLGTAIASYWS
jgi:hypothetical protein